MRKTREQARTLKLLWIYEKPTKKVLGQEMFDQNKAKLQGGINNGFFYWVVTKQVNIVLKKWLC